MSKPLAFWQEKYPQAFCWSFGDSPEMADELASLVIAGKNVPPAALSPAIRLRSAR